MSAKAAKRQRKETREWMQDICRAFVEDVRAMFKRRVPEMRERAAAAGFAMPAPCHTCALNPSTDGWRGFDKTMLILGAALEDERPFYCHENLPRDAQGNWLPRPTDEMIPCAGWATIVGDPDAKTAMVRAMLTADGLKADRETVNRVYEETRGDLARIVRADVICHVDETAQ